MKQNKLEIRDLWDCEILDVSWSSKVCKISENCARFGNCEAVCQNQGLGFLLFYSSFTSSKLAKALLLKITLLIGQLFKFTIQSFQVLCVRLAKFQLEQNDLLKFHETNPCKSHHKSQFYVWIETTSWTLGQTCKQQGEEELAFRNYTVKYCRV